MVTTLAMEEIKILHKTASDLFVLKYPKEREPSENEKMSLMEECVDEARQLINLIKSN